MLVGDIWISGSHGATESRVHVCHVTCVRVERYAEHIVLPQSVPVIGS